MFFFSREDWKRWEGEDEGEVEGGGMRGYEGGGGGMRGRTAFYAINFAKNCKHCTMLSGRKNFENWHRKLKSRVRD